MESSNHSNTRIEFKVVTSTVSLMTLILLGIACSIPSNATTTAILPTPHLSSIASPISTEPSKTPKGTSNVEDLSQQTRKIDPDSEAILFKIHEWPITDFTTRSVSLKEFRGEGPSRDGIPPLFDPRFESVEEADLWLDDQEPVQIVAIDDDVRAYPQQILIWHELVNDVVGGEPLLITY